MAFTKLVLARDKKAKARARARAKASSNFKIVCLLPAEIIEQEILPRLPVKSLLRFKSVCRSWNLLILSNNGFAKSQLDLNPKKESIVLEQTENIKGLYNSFFHRYSELIGCINGLVCVSYLLAETIEFALWNPATNRCLEIPPLRVKWYNTLLGFGFDLVSDDFKVVCATLFPSVEVDVYSCKAACWKKTTRSNVLYNGIDIHPIRPTIVNGSSFWLNRKFKDGCYSLVVITFDTSHEVFRLLPTVSYYNARSNRHVLINFRDSLAIMAYNVYNVELLLDVYVFNERCSLWNKISIETFMLPKTTRELYEIKLAFGNGDFLCGTWICGYRLYNVNLETRTIRILKEDESEEDVHHCCNYSESLMFIEGMKRVHRKRDNGRFKFLLREEL